MDTNMSNTQLRAQAMVERLEACRGLARALVKEAVADRSGKDIKFRSNWPCYRLVCSKLGVEVPANLSRFGSVTKDIADAAIQIIRAEGTDSL